MTAGPCLLKLARTENPAGMQQRQQTYVSMLDRNSMYVVYCLSSLMLSAHCLRLIEGLQVNVESPSWSKWQIARAIASLLFLSESSLLQSLLIMLRDLVKQSVPSNLFTNDSPVA